MIFLYRFYNRLARKLRGLYWKSLLFKCGSGTHFHGPIYIQNPKLVQIGKECTFNRDVDISGMAKVVIGDYVRFAKGVIINTSGLDYSGPRDNREHTEAPVIIKDGAWIGAGAIINPGVTLGEDCAVGAGSVVIQDVPPRTLVFGVPARIVQEIPKKN